MEEEEETKGKETKEKKECARAAGRQVLVSDDGQKGNGQEVIEGKKKDQAEIKAKADFKCGERSQRRRIQSNRASPFCFAVYRAETQGDCLFECKGNASTEYAHARCSVRISTSRHEANNDMIEV